jgi:hypothetical protein
MLGFEGTGLASTGNPIEDITNICAVHPIREDSLQELLGKYKGAPIFWKYCSMAII